MEIKAISQQRGNELRAGISEERHAVETTNQTVQRIGSVAGGFARTHSMADIDGDVRPDWCFFDIGADEFSIGLGCQVIHLPLVLRNY